MSRYDAIIIGAGHNGLAAGIILAKAGWKVLILERNAEPGGAVRTREVTLPGFRHDLFATNLNLFAGSPFFREFQSELTFHGLEFVPSGKPFSSVFPDGRYVGVSTDLEETLSLVGQFSQADARAWQELLQRFQRISPHLFSLLGLPMPSLRMGLAFFRGMRALGRQWPLELGQLLVQSPREFVEAHFESREVQALAASWGMHLDFPPDAAGGALFPFLECMASQMFGMVLGKGGAAVLIDSLAGFFKSLGGELRVSTPVERVLVRNGLATGVQVESGETIEAERAVIAGLVPSVLFGKLVDSSLPESFTRRVAQFRHGPGTFMIHLALSDLPDWKAGEELRRYSYVHISPYMKEMGETYLETCAGLLPASPTLVVGQPTAVDASRAPQGKHVLWLQVRAVPSEIRGDALGEIRGNHWEDVKEPFAERILDKIEAYAPGLREKILGQFVLAPTDLESSNPNLVGGDSLGGSHHLMQNFLFRPVPGWSRYRTPVKRLYMCGASTWPGAGVGAGSGRILGKLLTGQRLR